MSAQVDILQLPSAGPITGAESVPIVQNGVTVQTTAAAISASPSQPYTYLTVTQTPQLANSRYFGATNGLTLSDGGAQGLFNITSTGALLSLVNSGTGIQVKTSATALTSRSIATSGAGVTVANGGGVAGNPTISLTGQVANLANLSADGLLTITTAGAVSSTSIVGVADQTLVTNGNATTGSPTVGLADNPTLPGTGAVLLPFGSTAQRSTGVNGKLRYNTDTFTYEGYSLGAWATVLQVNGTGVAGQVLTSTGTGTPVFSDINGGTF